MRTTHRSRTPMRPSLHREDAERRQADRLNDTSTQDVAEVARIEHLRQRGGKPSATGRQAGNQSDPAPPGPNHHGFRRTHETSACYPNLNALLTFSRTRTWMSYEELNTTIPDDGAPTRSSNCWFSSRPTHRTDQLRPVAAPRRSLLRADAHEPRSSTTPGSPILKAEEEIREEEAAEAAEANEKQAGSTGVRAMPRTTTIPACPMKAKPRPIEEAIEVPSKESTIRSDTTQMGTIPLLTREEIRLAKKIETTRMIPTQGLECDYAARQAVEILQQVHNGDLPFDRTMRFRPPRRMPRRRSPSRSR